MRDSRRMGKENGESSAGVNYGRTELEVLYLLPRGFVNAYTELFHRALKEDSSSPLGGMQKKAEVGKAQNKKAKAPKGRGSDMFMIRNEKAFGQKKRIDKKLRALAREIQTGEEESERTHRVRCKGSSGCGRWREYDWKFCPWCGSKGED